MHVPVSVAAVRGLWRGRGESTFLRLYCLSVRRFGVLFCRFHMDLSCVVVHLMRGSGFS